MNLQTFIRQMELSGSRERSNYHLTLGGLRTALAAAPPHLPVLFDTGAPAGSFDSYRGYYIDVAIDSAATPRTVKQWRTATAKALKTTFTGYKGGDYPAEPWKPLWYSGYGEASAVAIVGAEVRGESFVLITKRIDY